MAVSSLTPCMFSDGIGFVYQMPMRSQSCTPNAWSVRRTSDSAAARTTAIAKRPSFRDFIPVFHRS